MTIIFEFYGGELDSLCRLLTDPPLLFVRLENNQRLISKWNPSSGFYEITQ
jgi:hypothetical protein